MNALTLLKRDHRAVERLFAARAAAGPRAQTRREKLAQQICGELRVHTQLEEEIFYPALREAGVEKGQIDEAIEEHGVAKNLIGEIEAGSGDAVDAKLEVLREAVRHHIEEEERHLFPSAMRRLDGAALAALGEQMEQRKRSLRTPSPSIGSALTGLLSRAIESLTPARPEPRPGASVPRRTSTKASSRAARRATTKASIHVKIKSPAHSPSVAGARRSRIKDRG